MAMSGGKDDGSPMMEINTTPLIDVMLVLLIMFIITIPIATHSVDIDLPVPNNDPPPPDQIDPIKNKVEAFIAVLNWGKYLGDEAMENGVNVHVASWSRMAPNTFPSLAKAGGNYLNASLVKMDAVLNGYEEGIMLNREGYVAEGSGENLFVIKNGVLHTAPSAFSILPGITRDSVFKIANDLGYEVKEAALPREALYIADELFFTGTAAEVTPIRSVDKYKVGSGTRGPITTQIQKAFFDIVEGGNDKHGWLTPVGASVTA